MKSENAKVLSNTYLANDTYCMILQTEIAQDVKAGQFVQVQVPNYYLRRPISVNEVNDNQLTIIYKVVGNGTNELSHVKENEEVNLFGPLGTGFPIEERDVVLVGGGVGVPPLVETAKRYLANHKHVTAVLGFNTKDQIILEERFKELGCDVYIATMDGSYGTKGTVMNVFEEKGLSKEFVEACGPLPMLKAIAQSCKGYISLESRMACGLGACMGCVVKDVNGESLRVCKDGPVFEIGKVSL